MTEPQRDARWSCDAAHRPTPTSTPHVREDDSESRARAPNMAQTKRRQCQSTPCLLPRSTMAARWAQAGREAPPRPPARPMNAPELTSALSVQVLPSQPTILSSTWSCKCPTRRMSMPSGSTDTQVAPAASRTRRAIQGGVPEPTGELRRSNLQHMVTGCHTLARRTPRRRPTSPRARRARRRRCRLLLITTPYHRGVAGLKPGGLLWTQESGVVQL